MSLPYPVPPPSYAPNGGSSKPADQQPLLGGDGSNNADDGFNKRPNSTGWGGHPWNNSGEAESGGDELFVGITVSQSSIDIRMAFIRKVYSILFLQIAATAIVGSIMRLDACRALLLNHSWIILIPLLGALASMVMLFFKRHSSPANLILLSLFTVLEAMGVGAAVAFVETLIVLQAICLTGLVFIGLTLYTMQSKRDFSGMAPYLGTLLMVMVFSSLFTMFFPWNSTLDLVYAGFGTLLFSAYIIFDTQMICKHLSPDDWVVACISLYLDAVNLFLNIVRVLSDIQER